MVEMSGALAIIPAWSNPDLLKRSLAGHPLIAYTLAASQRAAAVSMTVVLTQDEAIMRLANGAGVKVLPLAAQSQWSLASGSTDLPWITRAVIQALSIQPDVVVWLDPLAPLRPKNLVDQAASQAALQPAGRLVQTVAPLNSPDGKLWAMRGKTQLEPVEEQGFLFAQTGHVLAVRLESILSEHWNETAHTIPLVLEPALSPDLHQPAGWQWTEWTIHHALQDIVYAGHTPRALPEKTELLVLDFDGVLTDNRVWVDEEGHEQISAYRSDSLGLIYLRQAGIEAIVLSMETNFVVAARCRKMKILVLQGINDKATALRNLLQERHLDPACTVYLGNDMNDVPCFPLVGCAVVVADAEAGALRQADLVLTRRGGYGAVRELCERLIEKNKG
ncbi:MAG TPA: HAD hydrolase family protein [Anaerolineaceae bacterium]